MKITLARLQTALAIATANGDKNASQMFQTAIDEITPFAVDPYIMPDVLTPPAPAVDVAAMTKDEAHDAVQAGVITRQDAVDAGVIAKVDDLSPHPDEVQVIESPVAAPAGTDNPPSSSGADAPSEAPVPSAQPEPVVAAPDSPSPVIPSSDPAQSGGTTQVSDGTATGTLVPVGPDTATPNTVAPQADPGDETPASVDRLTALEQRVTADEAKEAAFEDEVRGGKVSRQ